MTAEVKNALAASRHVSLHYTFTATERKVGVPLSNARSVQQRAHT
jgi:hypothetical protein